MIGTIDIKCNAAHPNLPLNPLVSFKDSPSSVRILDVPKKIGNWVIEKVDIQVSYPDGSIKSKECVKNGAIWVGTVEGTPTVGKNEKGFVVVASGKDEDGNDVDGYVLGAGDVIVLDFDGTIQPGDTSWTFHLYNSQPENPKKGDAYFVDNILKVYDGTQWKDVGGVNLDDYIKIGDNFLRQNGRQTPIFLWDSNPEEPRKDSSNCMSLRGDGITMRKFDGRNHTSINPGFLVLEDDETEYSQQPTLQVGSWNKGLFLLGDYVQIFQYGDQKWATLDGHNILTDGDVEPDRGKQGYALYSSNADYATNAGDASYASTAGSALNADEATKATQDGSGNVITSTYATKNEVKNNKITIKQGGVEKGFFTLNQDTDKSIELDAGGGGGTEMVVCMIRSRDSGSGAGDAAIVVNKKSITIGSGRCITSLPKKVGVEWVSGYSGVNKVYLNNILVPDGNEIELHDGDEIVLEYGRCLEAHTLITMADGTTKMVCELKVGDKVLSLNPDTLQLEEDEVSDCDAGIMKTHNEMDIWTFADGTTIKTIHPHQFFNLRTNKMEYITDFQIGDGVRKQDGTTTTLIGHETVYGTFYHNTLFTKKFNNYFANGILTGNRHSAKWGWYWIENNA